MIESFIVVGTQVLILFLLIGLGFFGGRIKITTSEGVKCINDIMLYFVTPCVIINSFQRDFDPELFKNLILCIFAALLSHGMCVLLGFIFIHNKDERKRKVLRFASIFSNCGFMAFPLLKALLGDEGLFYGAGYVAIFNIVVWTYGQFIMIEERSSFNAKKAILNPGVIASVVGVIMFLCSIDLPDILSTPIGYMADLNTPVAMLIIGYTISTIDLKSIFDIKEAVPALIIRLLLSPLLMLGIFYLMGFRQTLLVACTVSVSAPVAATTTMFSIKFNADEALSSKLVASSTLLSIITMTLIVGFASSIA